jgi:2-dehydropantoate 2-reductase
MRVVVLGSGALGCVFAARLAPVAEVWMLGTWQEGLGAVERAGVSVEEPDGSIRVARIPTSSQPGAVPTADVALILVKSYQTERAAAWAAQVLRSEGLAVTLQNGLDNGPKIAARVGEDRVVLGVTYAGATLLGPGRSKLVANLATYVAGREAIADRVLPFVSLLNKAGLEAHATTGIQSRLWGKAIANAAINPLSALWRVPNGELLTGEDRRRLLAVLAQEGDAVARAAGVEPSFDDAVLHVESVCRATAANHSSMLQDVERGRPTEIDSINGVIVRDGLRLGVPTPYNEAVWLLVRGLRQTVISEVNSSEVLDARGENGL